MNTHLSQQQLLKLLTPEPVNPEDWRKEVERRRQAAVNSIRSGNVKRAIEAMERYSMLQSSQYRLDELLPLLTLVPSQVFWPVFASEWSACDATWHLRSEVLKVLRRQPLPAWQCLSKSYRRDYEALPNKIEVWRGCSRGRVRGLSWTTDKTVAAGFARGHRGIGVPAPTIAHAVIDKSAIFMLDNERSESEIILDPRRLSKLNLYEFLPPQALPNAHAPLAA
jgi:hypothetical protein